MSRGLMRLEAGMRAVFASTDVADVCKLTGGASLLVAFTINAGGKAKSAIDLGLS